MTKEEILKKAKELITGDRNETHGDAFQNHAEIAEFWNIFLDKKLKPMASLTAEDVALMMVLIVIQPDFSTALIIGAIGTIILFIAGAKIKHIII